MTSDAVPVEALKAIERAVWKNGITGDACARVAAAIVEALSDAGFTVQEASAP
jgi:hypothetical protein